MASLARMCLALLAAGFAPAAGAQAAGTLENPAGGTASGIGLVSGWHCGATRIEIEVDGVALLRAPHGSDRLDTLATCGRRDTGFALLLNWALMGPGNHTLRALADGVEFGRRTVTVVSLGAEFLSGRAASVTVPDFPQPGRGTVLAWREALQGFVAQAVVDAPALSGTWNGANLERRANCSDPRNDGTRGTYAQYAVTVDSVGGTLRIQQSGITGLDCTYTGAHAFEGNMRRWSGSYSCTDGKQGDFEATRIAVGANEMSIRLAIRLTGGESCEIDAVLGGARF